MHMYVYKHIQLMSFTLSDGLAIHTKKIWFYLSIDGDIVVKHSSKSALVILAGKFSCCTFKDDSHDLIKMPLLALPAFHH